MRRALFACALVACAPSQPATPAPSPAATIAKEKLEALHVEKNQLVRYGKPVRLLGVNHAGTEYACVKGDGIFEGPSDVSLARAIKAWGANTLRVPLNESCWLGIGALRPEMSGAAYREAIAAFVRRMRDEGLIVIVDLHWTAAGNEAATKLAPMPDADHAIDFWKSAARAFANEPDVVLDLFNEPFLETKDTDVNPWACWRDGCLMDGRWRAAGMQQLLDAVRGEGARNVVLASGLAYANDLSGWVAHGLADPRGQTAAAFHVYNFNGCVDERCWTWHLGPVLNEVPVVAAEIGQNDCGRAFIDRFMDFADARGVSYLGWTWNTWDCKKGPALIVDYTGSPTPYGEGLRARLRSHAEKLAR